MKVRAERCSGCLFGSTPVVPKKRQRELLAKLRRTDTHFICHLSPDGEEQTCHGSYEQMPQLVRIACRLGAVEFVGIDEPKLPESVFLASPVAF